MKPALNRKSTQTNKTSVKDFVSITLSVLALTISCLTFYFTNLRIVEKVEARLLGVSNLHLTEYGCPCELGIKMFIVNKGNRTERLVDLIYIIEAYDTAETHPPVIGNIFEKTGDSTIISLQPGEAKIFNFKIPSDSWKSASNEVILDDTMGVRYSNSGSHPYKEIFVKCTLSSYSINSDGEYIENESLFVIDSIEINNDYGLSVSQPNLDKYKGLMSQVL